MTPRRLLTGLALACLGVAVAYLPPRPRVLFRSWRDSFSIERNFEIRIRSTLRTEMMALALLERRDSALRNLESLENGRWLYIDPDLPEALDSAIRVYAAEDPPFDIHVRTARAAAAVFADSVRSRSGMNVNPPMYGPRTYHLLPAATDGRTCLTVSTIGPTALKEAADSTRREPVRAPYGEGALFGPCDFIEAFGFPSPSIEEWLRSGLLQSDGALQSRCVKGDEAACGALLTPRGQVVQTPYGPSVFSVLGAGLTGRLARFTALDRRFLATVLDSIGAERFTAFWTDPAPVPESFERHVGISAAEWFGDWLRPEPGAGAVRETVIVGGGLWLQAFLVVALGMGGAVVVVARRQVIAG